MGKEGNVSQVKKAFLLTGHRNWGKSYTLRENILGGKKRSVNINGIKVQKKTSSNGDDLAGVLKFINKKHPYIILAFCCDQANKPLAVLNALQSNGYLIYMYVLEHCFNNPNHTVSASEINIIQPYGNITILPTNGVQSPARAKGFYNFLQANIP